MCGTADAMRSEMVEVQCHVWECATMRGNVVPWASGKMRIAKERVGISRVEVRAST